MTKKSILVAHGRLSGEESENYYQQRLLQIIETLYDFGHPHADTLYDQQQALKYSDVGWRAFKPMCLEAYEMLGRTTPHNRELVGDPYDGDLFIDYL